MVKKAKGSDAKAKSPVITKKGIPQIIPDPANIGQKLTGNIGPIPICIYNPEVHDKSIYEILSVGGFIAHFCRAHNITRQTCNAWTRAHPSFGDAFERGKIAGFAFWLDLPRENPRLDFQYWSAIMKNVYQLYNPVIPELETVADSDGIVQIANSYLARGKIDSKTFEKLIGCALAKVKIYESTKMQENLQKIADKLKIKLNT